MSEPAQLRDDAVEAGASAPRLGRLLFVYSFATFGLMLAILMPSIFSLAYKVQLVDPGGKEAGLGAVASIGAVLGIVFAPALGRWSDRSRSRFGRRRPFLVAGILLLAAGATTIAFAPDVVTIIVGWSISQVGAAAASAAIAVLIVDHVPESRHGLFAALQGVVTQLAGVAGYLLGSLLTGQLLLLFLLPTIVLVAGAVLWWVTVPDRVPAEPPPAPTGRGIGHLLGEYVVSPRRHPDFAWVWTGKFLIQFGLAIIQTYALYYLLDRLGFTPEEAAARSALVAGIGVVCATGGAVVSGVLSDRLRRRKPFVLIAALLSAAGLGIVAFAQDFTAFGIGALLVLTAAGVFGAVDVALATDLIPKEHGARFVNVYSTSATIPAAVAPAVAPLLLELGRSGDGVGGYTLLFGTGAVLAVLGGLTVRFVRSVR